MASEESSSRSGLTPEASTNSVAEDPKDHDGKASSKGVEEPTSHKEGEEVTEQQIDVVEMVAVVRVNNEAEGKTTEVEPEAEGRRYNAESESQPHGSEGLKDNAESESLPHGSEGEEAGTGNQAEIKDEPGAGARDEPNSQADGNVGAPAGSEAKEAGTGDQAEIKDEPGAGAGDEPNYQADGDAGAPAGSEAKAGTGDQAEIKDEPGAGAEDEPNSQADGDVGAPADSESETTDAATAGTDGDQEDETSHKLTIDDIKTAPMDFRFPTTNQAKHCFTRYVEYHKCVQAKGADDPDCNKYARYYRSLCPGEWVDKWNEERENGTFAGPL